MSNDFWNNQEDEDFRDVPDEVNGEHAPPPVLPPAQKRRPVQPQAAPVEEEFDEIPEIEMEDEDDYTTVLSDARLRLEQGRLYEMIMNHDLFEGLQADPAAVKSVQRQIRKFAKEQMEIMLGMRQESARVETLQIDFPFNSVEVTVLKKLAYAASKGASENSDKYVPEVKRTTETVPVVSQPRKEGLNRIGTAAKQVKPVQKAAPVPAKPQSKLPTKPSKPVERKPISLTQQKILEEEGVSIDEIEYQFGGKPLPKPINEMTEDEIIQKNAEISSRSMKSVKSTSALPQPSPDQEAMLHHSRMMENPKLNGAVSMIMAAMNNKAKQ